MECNLSNLQEILPLILGLWLLVASACGAAVWMLFSCRTFVVKGEIQEIDPEEPKRP